MENRPTISIVDWGTTRVLQCLTEATLRPGRFSVDNEISIFWKKIIPNWREETHDEFLAIKIGPEAIASSKVLEDEAAETCAAARRVAGQTYIWKYAEHYPSRREIPNSS